jgi:hypothetical protein
MNVPNLEQNRHYYGDTVRFLFMVAAAVMLITLPSFNAILKIPVIVSVATILILTLSAGLTNPKQKWDALINVIISAIGFLVFETFGVLAYQYQNSRESDQVFFVTNIGLGLLFMISLYFSVKTLRGICSQEKPLE